MSCKEYEVVLYLGRFTNVYLFKIGVYQLRLSLSHDEGGRRHWARPLQLWVSESAGEDRVFPAQILDTARTCCSRSMYVEYEDQASHLGELYKLKIRTRTPALTEVTLKVELYFARKSSRFDAFQRLNCRKHVLKVGALQYLPLTFEPDHYCSCDLLASVLFTRPVGLTPEALCNTPSLYKESFDNLHAMLTPFNELPAAMQITESFTLSECRQYSATILHQLGQFITALTQTPYGILNQLRNEYFRREREALQRFICTVPPGTGTFQKTQLARRLKEASSSECGNTPNMPVFVLEAARKPKVLSDLGMPEFHVMVLVHGYKGTAVSMHRIQSALALHYPMLELIVPFIQPKTSIMQVGQQLADSIRQYIRELPALHFKLSFIGHSFGGLAVRAALPHLEDLARSMHTYISLSTPHLSLGKRTNWVVDLATSLYSKLTTAPEVAEMLLQDARRIEDSCLYRLSQAKGLSWFKKVVFVSCNDDSMVAEASASVTLPEHVVNTAQEAPFRMMRDNILREVSPSALVRAFVVFPQCDSAHTEYLRSPEFANLLSYYIYEQQL